MANIRFNEILNAGIPAGMSVCKQYTFFFFVQKENFDYFLCFCYSVKLVFFECRKSGRTGMVDDQTRRSCRSRVRSGYTVVCLI